MPNDKPMSQEEVAREANPTLQQRGSVYGPYLQGIRTRDAIIETMEIAYRAHHGCEMPREAVQCVWDIANKLSRIAVCPMHMDSWHDIAGYATLIETTLKDEGIGI